MGQGYSSTIAPTGPTALETSDLSDLIIEKSLGGARFLRTSRARHQQGIVVVKLCVKANATISFQNYAQALKLERQRLRKIPNVLPYARIRETGTVGILVRQFIHNSLYDRVSIRPFLEDIEKKWIAFQLMCAVRDCHSRGIFHGDIKSENVMVTSWGWVYLTDFASSFKPVYLPEDNPADFSFYYDTSARRTCYLAPERFLAAGQQPSEGNVVQWNMDIFSVGCVLAELFTESPTFTLSQLFRYRRGEYDPTAALLSKVDDSHVRSLIGSMIRVDPGERWHAQDYLDEYKGKAFPLYFYNHLHTLLQEVTEPGMGAKRATNGSINNGVADDRIDRLYNDYEMLLVSLGFQYQDVKRSSHQATQQLFPLQVDLPNSRHTAHSSNIVEGDNGTFILLNVVTASIRSAARSTTKVRACELLLAFAERLPDDAKLDRILSYIMPLLEDTNEMVLIAALRTMTQLLALVKAVSPVNSFLFTQYIFPRLQIFVKSSGFVENTIVRATYASCLGTLALTASRFLDMMQALRAANMLPSADKLDGADDINHLASQDAYDATRQEILEQFEGQTKIFLTDTDASVRRSFLTSVTSLCVFFGETMANDIVLTHLNTYLNDQDWLLKCAFFKAIVGVAIYIGSANVEEYILPLTLQALTDPQEVVIEQALRSLAIIAELGLIRRSRAWELIDTVARFQMHPNIWIKEAAAHFITASTTFMSTADIRIIVSPLIQPYLKFPIVELDESEILDALNKPLPRAVLDMALQWAAKAEKTAFWKLARDSRLLSYSASEQMPPRSSVLDTGARSLARITKTAEDEQWLGRLKNAGLRSEDEMKLLAFREFIWRASQRTKRDDEQLSRFFDQILILTELKVTPHIVEFDSDVKTYEQHVQQRDRTIAEALEEASNPTKSDAAAATSLPHRLSVDLGDRVSPSRPLSIVDRQRHSLMPGLPRPGSGSLSSSPSSAIRLLRRESDQTLRSRASNLATLNITGKAHAEVGTEDVNITGQVDLPRSAHRRDSPSVRSDLRAQDGDKRRTLRLLHNYDGRDPSVLKLLDTVYVDKFSMEAAEFGARVVPVTGSIPCSNGQSPANLWRPQSQLIAVLGEHTAKVSRIVVAPDHAFFLTAADDGTVKIWDTSRLERNVTHKSRQTYRLGAGVKATSLCFVDGFHSFVCTGSDGSVHIVRVDLADSNGTIKYSKLRLVREWQIPSQDDTVEHAVWSEHFRGQSSTLMLATNLGRIIALDLRHMSVIFEMQNPPSHGQPTTFCMNRKHEWLLLGTSHGVLDFWDLRFQLRLRSWVFTNAAPITRLQICPGRKSARRNRVCVSGGTARGEVSIWDLEKVICLEVLRPAYQGRKEQINARNYELRNLDDEQAQAPLERVTAAWNAQAQRVEKDLASPGHVISAIMGVQAASAGKDTDTPAPFVIAGGPDGRVRFFDCDRLDGCRLVSGAGLTDEKPSYTFSQLSLDTKILSEKAGDSSAATGGAVESNKVSAAAGGVKRPGATRPPSRYDTIRLSAQNLPTGHLDTITDVAMIERPFGMIVSADRSGQVFVHQ